jgi:glycosyltransferase involved in cell wall biosynthesis
VPRLSVDASALAYRRRTGIGRVLESVLPELVDMAGPRIRIRLFAGGPIKVPLIGDLIREGRLEVETARSPSLYLWQQSVMGHAIGRFRPAAHLAPEALLPMGLRTPALGIVHDLLWRRHPETCKPHVRLVCRLRFAPSLAASSAILCDSGFTRDELESLYPGCGPAPHVARLGVCTGRFRPASDADMPALDRFRAAHRLEQPYLLAVGNIRPHKNLGLVTEALRRMQAAGECVPPFAVIGTSSAALDDRIDPAGLPPGTVRRIGFLDDEEVALAYRGALALVFPSRYEGFGLPVLEAMASGLPVLHARAGALPEVAGDAGIAFDPGDPGQLAAAIRRLHTQPGLAAELRSRGLRRAAEFSWRKTAQAWWERLEPMLLRRNDGRGEGPSQ